MKRIIGEIVTITKFTRTYETAAAAAAGDAAAAAAAAAENRPPSSSGLANCALVVRSSNSAFRFPRRLNVA
jgi:hypothetical protein